MRDTGVARGLRDRQCHLSYTSEYRSQHCLPKEVVTSMTSADPACPDLLGAQPCLKSLESLSVVCDIH